MTLNPYEFIDVSLKNKKRASLAMSKAVCLLFVITFSSLALNHGIFLALASNPAKIESALVQLIKLFGVSLPSALVAAKAFISSGVFFEFITVLISIVTMIIPTAVFARFANVKSNEYFNVGGKMIKGFWGIFCLGQLLTIAVSFFSGGIYDYLVPPNPDIYTGSFTATSPDIFMFFMEVLFTCIFVPAMEEYIFRGVLFSYLRRYGLAFGVVASSFLFGIAHFAPVQSVYAFTFGILSAFAVSVTGNIKTSVLFHALNNLVTVIMGYIQVFLGRTLSNVIYCLYLAVIIISAFIGLYKFASKNGLYSTYQEAEKENDGGLEVKPGISEIMTLPVALYVLIYCVRFLLQVI